MGRYHRATVGVTVMLLVGLGVSACGADEDSSADSTDASEIDTTIAVAAEPGRASEGLDATPTGEATDDRSAVDSSVDSSADGAAGGSIGAITGRSIATTAGVTVVTTDIRSAVDDTLTAVERNGGLVFTADVNIGDERDDGSVDGSGYFVVKVPPGDLELLIADLGATVGELSGRTQDAADVTDQLVDLDIRIGVERDVIDRFRDLLGDATELTDIIEIERVISERTIALEQLLAGQRNLENRVELSTLTIELQYTPMIVETVEPDDGIAGAWRTGWEGFVGAFFAIGFALAVTAPFLLTALVLASIGWLLVRRRRAQNALRSDPTAPEALAAAARVSSDGGIATVDGALGDDALTPDEQQAVGPSHPG